MLVSNRITIARTQNITSSDGEITVTLQYAPVGLETWEMVDWLDRHPIARGLVSVNARDTSGRVWRYVSTHFGPDLAEVLRLISDE